MIKNKSKILFVGTAVFGTLALNACSKNNPQNTNPTPQASQPAAPQPPAAAPAPGQNPIDRSRPSAGTQGCNQRNPECVLTGSSLSVAAVALDNQDRPLIAYFEGSNHDRLYVVRQEGGTWNSLGRGPVAASASGFSTNVGLAVDSSGAPVVSFLSPTRTPKIMRYEGNLWSPMMPDQPTGQGIRDLIAEGDFLHIFVQGSGNLSHINVVYRNHGTPAGTWDRFESAPDSGILEILGTAASGGTAYTLSRTGFAGRQIYSWANGNPAPVAAQLPLGSDPVSFAVANGVPTVLGVPQSGGVSVLTSISAESGASSAAWSSPSNVAVAPAGSRIGSAKLFSIQNSLVAVYILPSGSFTQPSSIQIKKWNGSAWVEGAPSFSADSLRVYTGIVYGSSPRGTLGTAWTSTVDHSLNYKATTVR